MKNKPDRDSLSNIILPLGLIVGLFLLLSLNMGPLEPKSISENSLEPLLKLVIGYLAAGAEIAAAIVIAVGIFGSLIGYFKSLLYRSVKKKFNITESIRLRLGRSLTLGLEFTVASDILRTAVAPTRQDILNLGAIVLLRTLLNYFLELEIAQAEERHQANPEQEESSNT